MNQLTSMSLLSCWIPTCAGALLMTPRQAVKTVTRFSSGIDVDELTVCEHR